MSADGPSQTGFFDQDTDLESFTGVVSGTEGPWGVGVHVARVTTDDHVAAACVHRTPVGTADVFPEGLWPKNYLSRAGEFAAEMVSRLGIYPQWPD